MGKLTLLLRNRHCQDTVFHLGFDIFSADRLTDIEGTTAFTGPAFTTDITGLIFVFIQALGSGDRQITVFQFDGYIFFLKAGRSMATS